MVDDCVIRRLVEEALASDRSPEELCREHPECLAEVRSRLRGARAVAAELDAMFPVSDEERLRSAAMATRTKLPRIEGYDVESLLGQGGMGVVFRARHRKLDRAVAVKMLLAGAWAAPAQIGRFRREAEAVARVRHPNIVQIYDVGECDGRPYFTMELVEGGSLADMLAARPLPIDRATSILLTLADAVRAAHAGGIVHRDLKPANILLDTTGAPRITDFGLARPIDGESTFTVTGTRLGTPSYMAPEQALGSPRKIGPAVDIYALGAILYEMLTGRPPFRGESAIETERQVIAEEPVPPSRLNRRVPRDLETICLACLRKDPSQRFASAAALREDLERFRDGRPITARPIGFAGRIARWVRRKPTAAALLVTAIALLGVGAIAGAREWTHATQRRTESAKWSERLAFVERMLHEGRFSEARAILGRIPDSGSAKLGERIRHARAELATIEELDAIRLSRGVTPTFDRFDERADQAYEAAFVAAGLGSPDEPATDVAARIRARAMRTALVAALDDWVLCVRDRGRVSRLLSIARLSDPDPWRDRVRTPSLWSDPATLSELAANVDATVQSVPLLLTLAGLLESNGLEALPFYHRVQVAHPDDYWANFVLAEALGATDEAIGFYRAALALRPAALPALTNLANVLAARGRSDEADAHWERALQVEPGSIAVLLNQAIAALNRRHPERALELAETVLARDPSSAHAHSVTGRALTELGRFSESVTAFEKALATLPTRDPTHPYVTDAAAHARRFSALERRLPEILAGQDAPVDDDERLDLARISLRTQRFARAARYYAEVFANDPAFGTGGRTPDRYDAACCAALAGSSRDRDRDVADHDAGKYRALARRWLLEELDACAVLLDRRDVDERETVRRILETWRNDPDLESVRELPRLAALPPVERDDFLELWHEVASVLARTHGI